MITEFITFTQQVFLASFLNLWNQIILFIPRLLGALIVFALGWFVAKLIYKLVLKLSSTLKIDHFSQPLTELFERAGYQLHLGKIIGFLVKWFIVIGALIISLEILNLASISELLKVIVILHIPKVIVAIIVLVAGITLADFVKKLVKGSTKMLNVKSAGLLANIARIAVIVITSLIALNLVGVSSAIIDALFIGVIAMVALAGGLAFGLGGRDAAAQAIEDIKKSMHK